jgi:hypothetical protein
MSASTSSLTLALSLSLPRNPAGKKRSEDTHRARADISHDIVQLCSLEKRQLADKEQRVADCLAGLVSRSGAVYSFVGLLECLV